MNSSPSPTRPLGATGPAVSELGFGGAPLGNLYRPVADSDAHATLTAAWAAGLRYFDTAPFYGFGLSERRVGDALRSRPRDAFVLSTKVGRRLVPAPSVGDDSPRHGFCSPLPFEPVYDYSYSGVMRSVEDSLQRLGLARIDVALIHDIGEMTHGEAHAEQFRTCMEGGYRALDELRAQGVIGAVGLGVNEAEVCLAAMAHGRFDCFLLAGRYTLLEQAVLDDFLPACEGHGASLIIGGVYNSGILATGTRGAGVLHYDYAPAPAPIRERVRRIEAICATHGVTLAAAALQFPLAHPQVACIIPGLDSAERLTQTLALRRETIPADFWNELKSQGLLHASAPVPD